MSNASNSSGLWENVSFDDLNITADDRWPTSLWQEYASILTQSAIPGLAMAGVGLVAGPALWVRPGWCSLKCTIASGWLEMAVGVLSFLLLVSLVVQLIADAAVSNSFRDMLDGADAATRNLGTLLPRPNETSARQVRQ